RGGGEDGALARGGQPLKKLGQVKRSGNLRRTFSRNSSDALTTGGKSSRISHGRQASITAREFHGTPLGRRGSSGPLQARRMKSMSSTGSQRVHIAHSTCSRLVGSMSSSTTTTKRPR